MSNINDQVKKIREAEAAAEARKAALLDELRQQRRDIDEAMNELEDEPRVYTTYPDETFIENDEHVGVERRDSGYGFRNFVAGAALTALLIGGGYLLVKEIRKGKIVSSDDTRTITASLTDTTDAENKQTSYSYNYDKNIATVTTTTTETLGETTVTITEEGIYEELTTEKFEELCSNAIRYFDGLGISVKKSDVVKFVADFNIDKLKQDNPELVKSLLGTQIIEEFKADAEKVSDTLINNETQTAFADDNAEWQAYIATRFEGAYCPDTTKLVSIADFAFDKEQQALIRSFEARRDEILQVADLEVRSDMTKALLLDIMNAKSEYRLFDDSTLYYVLRHCVVPLDSMYNWNFLEGKSTLSEDAYRVMVEFIAPVGSTEEEIQNSIMSGARRNMMDSFKECQAVAKTYSK